jgi:large subunit ribosomal protein L6
MSRIGKSPVILPSNVQLNIDGKTVKAKGPKGELSYDLPEIISIEQNENVLNLVRPNDSKTAKAQHGLARSMVANLVNGVSEGNSIKLDVDGVGFRAEMKGTRLILSLGLSHPVVVIPPDGIELKALSQTKIEIAGTDKQLVGEVAAKIRRLRKPEPYKGKGIKYEGEYIRRKAGKTSAK